MAVREATNLLEVNPPSKLSSPLSAPHLPLFVAASYAAGPSSQSAGGPASPSPGTRKRPPMPIHKSPLAALSLALASVSAPHVSAADVEQLTFSGRPSVIECAVLHLCDIELQAGEVITDLKVGDNARWSITPAITGTGPNEVHHLVIRPFAAGIETSAMVATTVRTYHLQLRAGTTRYMPRVTFIYPDEIQRKLESEISANLNERQRGLIPGTNEYLGDLDFAYRVNGESALKPLRVFNNRLKTVIELSPANAKASPSLIVTEAGGGPRKPVEYSMEGVRLVASSLFDAATLVYGSGSQQKSVTIERINKTGNGKAGLITTAAAVPVPPSPSMGDYTSATASAPPQSKPLSFGSQNAPGSAISASATSQPAIAAGTAQAPTPKVVPAPAPSTYMAPRPTPTTGPQASSPAYKPAAPTAQAWDASVGSSLRKTVESWSARGGWTVDWQADDLDYPIDAPLHFTGSYEEAIYGVFSLYKSAKRAFVVDGRRKQKLLIITEKVGNNGYGAAQ